MSGCHKNHFAIGIINGMDYFHFFLHRKYQPWSRIRIVDVTSDTARVEARYEISVTHGRAARILKRIIGDKSEEVIRRLNVSFVYPYHSAEMGDDIKVWAFFLPESETAVRAFITMYVKATGISRVLRHAFHRLFKPLILKQIQREDAWIGEQEQKAWELYPQSVRHEVNPISAAVENVIVSQWQQHVASEENKLANPAQGVNSPECPTRSCDSIERTRNESFP
jgi:renierapurpurin 18,18'-hydroxylase